MVPFILSGSDRGLEVPRVGGIDAIMFRYSFARYGDLALNRAIDACNADEILGNEPGIKNSVASPYKMHGNSVGLSSRDHFMYFVEPAPALTPTPTADNMVSNLPATVVDGPY